ncbi:MAG: alpha-galactosidase [Alistipes sp.]|nr:alpha-galactosidase [Alistipes sp.]
MKYKIYFMFLMMAMLCVTSPTVAQTSQKMTVPTSIDKWITTTFAKGKTPPFSFVYDGVHSQSFIRKWRHSIVKGEGSDGVVTYTISYADKITGLKVECHVKGFQEFGAVEWVLNFRNEGGANSKQITSVKTLDYSALSTIGGEFKVLHAMGSNHDRADFRPQMTTIKADAPLTMSPMHGRSSDTSAFPFFNLITPDNRGVVVAVGWTGTWFADIAAPAAGSVSVAAGMKTMDLHLYPGEAIRTPLVAMLFWQGEDYMTGNNKFRRFVLAHHTRKPSAELGSYSPLCGGMDWGDPAPCNEYGCLTEEYAVAIIKRYEFFELKPEVIWLDAGWYEGSGGWNANWWNSVGSWVADKKRFPRGLKPLSDAAHSIGAKFMVWFEPERVYDGSRLAKEHPEWLLKVEPGNNLLDLGNKEALDWLCKYIGDFMQENGIDYYRQDFNMPISPYWAKHDEPGRIGMKEIRHIEGLYAYWDYLIERFPALMIDNCASGGRRLDLETTSRSIPLWRTDYQYSEVNGYQCHTYALNFFLPLHGTGTYHVDAYGYRSSMSSATVCNWVLTGQGVTVPGMQNYMQQFRELRPYYLEDFYPLTGLQDHTPDTVWLAYQLNRPSDDTGIVVAFRRRDNLQPEIDVQLRGLKSEATYQVLNVDTGESVNLSGEELMRGLKLKLDMPYLSLLLKYKLQ